MGKHIIEIPDDMIIGREIPKLAIKTQLGNMKSFVFDTGLKLTPYDDAEQRGADKAWAFVRWIWEEADLIEVFHMAFGDVLAMGYQDARAKTDEWKQEKEKEDDEIKVGDEVRSRINRSKICVVTNIMKVGENTQFSCIRNDGKTDWFSSAKNFEKTGRHFPAVVELLKEIGGNNNE